MGDDKLADKSSPRLGGGNELGLNLRTVSNGNGAHHGRLHRLLHPSGRTVHIANTPEYAESLKRDLTEEHGEGKFDLFIRGSKEHVSSLIDSGIMVPSRSRQDSTYAAIENAIG